MKTDIQKTIMDRVYRVHLIKKLSGKFCLFIFASIIGMTFVSTIDVLRNALHVAKQADLLAIFYFIKSAFTNTEHITYVAITLSLTAIFLMIKDVWSFKPHRIEFN